MKLIFVLALGLTIPVPPGWGQEKNREIWNTSDLQRIALPSGPLIKRLPKIARWRIVYTFPKTSEGEIQQAAPTDGLAWDLAETPEQTIVTRVSPNWNSVTILPNKQKCEQWQVALDRFIIVPGQPVQLWSQLFPFFFNFQDADFPDVEWVSPRTFIGAKSVGDRTTLVFREKSPQGPPMTVWVDQTARIPVRWQKGGEVRQFQVLNPPSQALVPPGEIASLAKEMDEFHKASGHLPGK